MLANCGKQLRNAWLRRGRCVRLESQSTTANAVESSVDAPEEEFRQLQLIPPAREDRRQKRKMTVDRARQEIMPPRSTRMPIDQDWPSVWPVAHSFKQSAVPLPVRMGFEKKRLKKPPPGKYGNLELMKIPNFLHLTPSAIKRHCAAIKGFCTEWPKELASDELVEQHLPLKLSFSDYVHAGPSLRDPRARIVTLTVKLSSIGLDYHAKDKLLRLVGNRYNSTTDVLTLVTDRCPARHQNKSYSMYLLTALVFESKKLEPWEGEKTDADMEKFFWEGSKSQAKVLGLIDQLRSVLDYKSGDPEDKRRASLLPSYLNAVSLPSTKEEKLELPEVKDYCHAWDKYRNEIESEENLLAYGQAVQKLLGIQNLTEV